MDDVLSGLTFLVDVATAAVDAAATADGCWFLILVLLRRFLQVLRGISVV